MTMKRALRIILGVALVGMSFSGVLTYRELFAATPVATCPSPGPPGTILGYPACVYGFFMYLVVAGVALWGLIGARKPRGAPRAPRELGKRAGAEA